MFVKVNTMPAVGKPLTAKHYVNEARFNKVDETKNVGKNQLMVFLYIP